MKIYCKPYMGPGDSITGSVVDIESNTTNLPTVSIDDIYEDYPVEIERLMEKSDEDLQVVLDEDNNPVMVQAIDEETGEPIYDTIYEQRLKDCVVEFDVTDKYFLKRTVKEKLCSIYWNKTFSILSGYETCNSEYSVKANEIEAKIKAIELERNLEKTKESSDLINAMNFDIIEKIMQDIDELKAGV